MLTLTCCHLGYPAKLPGLCSKEYPHIQPDGDDRALAVVCFTDQERFIELHYLAIAGGFIASYHENLENIDIFLKRFACLSVRYERKSLLLLRFQRRKLFLNLKEKTIQNAF